MSGLTAQGWPLENLGLNTATFRRLHSQGLRNLEDFLSRDPAEFANRSQTWSEIRQALERVVGRLDETEVERIHAFLKAGDETADQRAARPRPEIPPGLPPALSEVYQAVRRYAHPVTRRSLMREYHQARPLLAQLGAPPFVLYPYGLQGWVGLEEWGQEGYRKAARSSWNVLPLHLRKLSSQGQTLPEQAWHAIRDVAVERQDVEMLVGATEALTPVIWPQPTSPESTDGLLVRETVRPPTPSLLPPETAPSPGDPLEAPAEVPTSPAPAEVSYYAQLPNDLKALLARSQPRLFAGLEYDDILGGATALVGAARSQISPFSLVELGGTIGDYQWLKKWAKALDWYTANEWLHDLHPLKDVAAQTYWSGSDCLGSLLLFLCAESGRRDAREGEIWRHIPNHFGTAARAELFMGGQPRSATRRAIESAAKRLGVRHAFDTEGSHAWYQTIYLQFGFTQIGVQALPLWLGGLDHAPSAVACLYEESAQFRSLWDTLRGFRSKSVSAQNVSAEILANPFTLNSWNTEILRFAQLQLEGQDSLSDSGELPLLRARLVWPELAAPAFELSWQGLPTLGLIEGGYNVYHDGQQVARLALEGTDYQSYPPDFLIPIHSPYLTLELEGDGSEDEREVDQVLWDTDEEFHLFDAKTGLALSKEKSLNSQRSVHLLAGPGVRLEPAPELSHELAGGRTLFALTAPWNPETTIVDDSGLVATLHTKSPPSWIAACELVCPDTRPLRFGESASVYLQNLPREANVVSARAWSKAVEFVKHGATWDGRVPIDPASKTSNISVRFTVQCPTGRYSFQRSAKVGLHDVALRLPGKDEWQPFNNLPCLTAQELKRAKVRFFLQPDHAHYGLMGDTTFRRRPPARLSSLELAGGYGESLALWEGPYNRLADSKTHRLCCEYLDCGLLRGIRWHEDGRFELQLSRPIEPSPDHFLLFWNVKGELEVLTTEDLDSWERGLWCGQLSRFSGPVSVSLGFEDRRLGSARSPGFEPPWHDQRTLRTAGLLRWMKLPLLRESWRDQVRAFAEANMNDCLSSWVFDSQMRDAPAVLAYEDTEEWSGVVRSCLHEVPWQRKNSQQIWDQLLTLKRDKVTPAEHFMQLLLAVPLTALELGREVLGHNEFRVLVEGMLMAPYGTARFKDKMKILGRDAADAMGSVDDRFLDSLLKNANSSNSRARENLQLGLQRPAFVRYLASKTLAGWLADGMKGGKYDKA